MKYAGHEVNPLNNDAWSKAIGDLVINFGAVEFMTHLWAHRLGGYAAVRAIQGKLFLPRQKAVLALLEQSPLEAPTKAEARDAWETAGRLAKFRNQIAHGPIVLAWKNRDAGGPPDVIATLDFKNMTLGAQNNVPFATIDSVRAKVEEVFKAAERLSALVPVGLPPPDAGLMQDTSDNKGS